MERHVDELLAAIADRLLRMGALAEGMLADALRLLERREGDAATRVARHEREVNDLQIEIDEMCLHALATQQPVAGDLRYLLAVVKTNGELERLADLAVNVCDKAVHLLGLPAAPSFPLIPEMGAIASEMARDSLLAFVKRDSALARKVLERDDELDERKRAVTGELIERIRQAPDEAAVCVQLLLVARNLERVGDHATNIAENAIFEEQGRDIRHHAETAARPPL
jgi:phosphate transport system protein